MRDRDWASATARVASDALNVRYSDMPFRTAHVRFRGQSGHSPPSPLPSACSHRYDAFSRASEEALIRWKFIGSFGGVTVIVVALAGSGSAQQFMPGMNLVPESRPLTSEEREKRKAIDDAYRSAIEKLPDQKKSADPWGDVRSTKTTSSKQRQ